MARNKLANFKIHPSSMFPRVIRELSKIHIRPTRVLRPLNERGIPPPYVYSIKRYSSKITISRIALVIRLWITNPPWRVDNNSPTSFHENIPWNIPENNRLSRERLENCILVSIFPSPLPPPPPRSRMPRFARLVRKAWERGGRGGSERVSKLSGRWRGGGRGCSSTNWTPAAWQYNYGLLPRADACVFEAFSPVRNTRYQRSIGWKITTLFRRFFRTKRRNESEKIKIKSGKSGN